MTVFLVPLAQWLVVFVVAPFVVAVSIAGRNGKDAGGRRNE
jgi:hypothetical protein